MRPFGLLHACTSASKMCTSNVSHEIPGAKNSVARYWQHFAKNTPRNALIPNFWIACPMTAGKRSMWLHWQESSVAPLAGMVPVRANACQKQGACNIPSWFSKVNCANVVVPSRTLSTVDTKPVFGCIKMVVMDAVPERSTGSVGGYHFDLAREQSRLWSPELAF